MNRDSKHIDEIFRKKFESFEVQPPEHVWNNIQASLSGNTSGTLFSNPVSLATLAAIILIALFLGLNVFKQSDLPTTQPSGFSPKDASSSTKTNPAQPAAEETSVSGSVQEPGIIKNDAVQSFPEGPSTTFGKHFDDENATEKQTLAQKTIRDIDPIGFAGPLYSFEMRSLPVSADRNAGLKPVISSHKNSTYDMKPELLLGLRVTPGVMFFPDDNIQKEANYRVDLSTGLQFRDFFVETGLGINFSKDNGGYDYDYKKYLGTYDDVYQVTFDSTENGIIPTYHTNPVDVYDSVKETYVPTKNHYTYLEIPLYLGFRKQVNRLSYFVKGGPAFALLIHKNIPDVNLAANDEIIDIKKSQPLRVNTNWQIVLGAGIDYRIHRNLSLSVEPVFRYYVRSAYERRYIKSRHTYDIGLRAGVLYNF